MAAIVGGGVGGDVGIGPKFSVGMGVAGTTTVSEGSEVTGDTVGGFVSMAAIVISGVGLIVVVGAEEVGSRTITTATFDPASPGSGSS